MQRWYFLVMKNPVSGRFWYIYNTPKPVHITPREAHRGVSWRRNTGVQQIALLLQGILCQLESLDPWQCACPLPSPTGAYLPLGQTSPDRAKSAALSALADPPNIQMPTRYWLVQWL